LLLLFSFLSWTWTPMAQSHHTVFFLSCIATSAAPAVACGL
jgi:hypothetical protein